MFGFGGVATGIAQRRDAPLAAASGDVAGAECLAQAAAASILGGLREASGLDDLITLDVTVVAPSGGVYVLVDPSTGRVMRSGRTNELGRRRLEHARDARSRGFDFEVLYKTDSYPAQRGLEHMVHNKYSPPPDRIRPVSPKNPRINNVLTVVITSILLIWNFSFRLQ